MSRRSGVFLNVSSLPSPYGIGVLGQEAYNWIDFLTETGFSLWQILPTVPIGAGNSPYASPSAFAGNTLYICPDLLADQGLISEAERKASEYTGKPYSADYKFAAANSEKLIRLALNNADDKLLNDVYAFEKKNPHIQNYALYMAIKDNQSGRPFWLWDKGLDFDTVSKNCEAFKDEIKFYVFGQYLFFQQWAKLKAYANSKGIKIFGDMPIYVSRDSVDLWSAIHLFAVNAKTAKPSMVAGVPPDYFSEDGQLWGNPLYNWAAMKKDGYNWWKQRIDASFKLYDVLRIDHFRGLASYWAVPASAKTAKEGKWEKGPGFDLFKAIGKPKGEIIAEDLGEFGEDVVKLLDETGFPGMHVAQFAFNPNGESEHAPHMCEKNSVAYIGTHDNNTLLGWLFECDEETRNYVLDYCGADRNDWQQGGRFAPACRKIIETFWRCASDTTIISFQDLCGYGADTRMNTPGEPLNNWEFRATKQSMNEIDKQYYIWLNKTFRR